MKIFRFINTAMNSGRQQAARCTWSKCSRLYLIFILINLPWSHLMRGVSLSIVVFRYFFWRFQNRFYSHSLKYQIHLREFLGQRLIFWENFYVRCSNAQFSKQKFHIQESHILACDCTSISLLIFSLQRKIIQIISSLNVHLGAMSNDLLDLAEVKHSLKQTQYRLERMLQ